MTTIIGIQYDNGFIMAADSQVTVHQRPFSHSNVRKITEVGQYVIAGSGNARYCDSVQYGWEPPVYTDGDKYMFMVKEFIPAMKEVHDNCGYSLKDGETFYFLIGLENELFYICEDYSIVRTEYGIYASGTGGELAMGALFAGASVEQAMGIAKTLDINSGGDTIIVKRGM
jgi:ATP-dependent protease HslVU (ClpYQ) peptidase subunit